MCKPLAPSLISWNRSASRLTAIIAGNSLKLKLYRDLGFTPLVDESGKFTKMIVRESHTTLSLSFSLRLLFEYCCIRTS